MPHPYSAEDVQYVTAFFGSLFHINFQQATIYFIGSYISSSSANIIGLKYELDISGYKFYMSIEFNILAIAPNGHNNNDTNNIRLLSNGSNEIPFKKLIQFTASFTESYIDFERRKDMLLIHLQNLP